VNIKEGERFCSSHTSYIFKGNCTKTASFFVFAFEEKRVEQPHLLVGFSLVLDFPFHIMCLFVDGV
jgi:hypothetical protein